MRVTEDGRLKYLKPESENLNLTDNKIEKEQLKLGRLKIIKTPVSQYRSKFGTNFTSKLSNTKVSRLSTTPAQFDLPSIKQDTNSEHQNLSSIPNKAIEPQNPNSGILKRNSKGGVHHISFNNNEGYISNNSKGGKNRFNKSINSSTTQGIHNRSINGKQQAQFKNK